MPAPFLFVGRVPHTPPLRVPSLHPKQTRHPERSKGSFFDSACTSHFFSRSRAIFRCSSAASRNSVASSLCKRRRRISRISMAGFPVAHKIKMRLKRSSYSWFARARANFTCSTAVATRPCSSPDHASDLDVLGPAALDSPIRGWLWNASFQSDSAKLPQTASQAFNKSISLEIGLRSAIPRAQLLDPQQGTISLAASSSLNLFHRPNTSLMDLFAAQCSAGLQLWLLSCQRLRPQPLQIFCHQIPGYRCSIFCRRANIINWPHLRRCALPCGFDKLSI
jgi:hypothetical protein